MSEANKTALRRVIEDAFGKGNLDVLDDVVADNFVDHSPPPGVAADKSGVKQVVTMFRSAFPDLSPTIEDMIAEGDRVACRLVTTGTHKGELMGIAPTGRRITVAEQHIVRCANGKIVEHWGVEDNLGMMVQLGVVQMP